MKRKEHLWGKQPHAMTSKLRGKVTRPSWYYSQSDCDPVYLTIRKISAEKTLELEAQEEDEAGSSG